MLILMVVNDAQVEAVLFGPDGALETLPEAATIVLSSTVPAGYVRGLGERLAARGRHAARRAGERRRDRCRGRPAHDHGLRGRTRRSPGRGAALEAWRRRSTGWATSPGSARRSRRSTSCWPACNLVTAAEGHGVRRSRRRRSQGAVRGDLAALPAAAGCSSNRVPHMLDGRLHARARAVDIWVKDLGLVLDTGTDAEDARCRWRPRPPIRWS